ncbi:hypothetical protein BCIN_03g00260 [Botrytis cinerea B05.10]|uniref:Uncharacterized protein n=1 Tax=Botryotinia fuckeliana (strain B05.10) TaxID=332648 RepID=A0A384JAW1_BOTFB|nr:hypothetical protein BCIN_03g00260 [Botrytis cinerea B05.10]ATZ47716.1 hypothetical protein BCIN_03g00260 [Botrytis cinerea B05.10]
MVSFLPQCLRKFDSARVLCRGAGSMHEDTFCAHGENGYIDSNAAVNMLPGPGQPEGLAANWSNDTDGCGDVALAKALYEYCVNLNGSIPLPTITNLLPFLIAQSDAGSSFKNMLGVSAMLYG